MSTKTINNTMSSRVEAATALAGSEALSVENVQQPDQTISAGVEEQTALNAFKDHQMQSLLVRSTRATTAQFLGVRYAILDLNIVGPDTITFTGDLTEIFQDGDLVRIENTVSGDDGIYQIEGVAEAIGVTTLTLADGNLWQFGGGGAVGTFARVCSHQRMGRPYDIATATLATGIITIAGDVSNIFAVGDFVTIDDSTGNDGFWEITVVTTDGPPVTTTSITLVDATDAAGNTIPDNTDDGNVIKVRPAIKLAANIPFFWTIDSGVQNPFTQVQPDFVVGGYEISQYNENIGDVAFCMVNNAGADDAEFQVILSTNAIIF